jgi:hypothetical protein
MKWLNCEKMRFMLIVFVAAIIIDGGSTKADFTFGEPVNLGPTINSSSGDALDCVSYDGLEMYIDSNRSGGYGTWDIWVSTRETIDDEWGAPVNLGPNINFSWGDVGAFLSSEDLEMYFCSYNSPGGYGYWDIWLTKRAAKEDPWGEPENLGPPVNTSAWDGYPSISSDGLELYFSSRRSGGYGSDDMWVSRRTTINDPWEKPVNLGAVVNSSASESFPFLSSDGLLLLFSEEINSPLRSGGFGNEDMWMTRRKSVFDPWSTPVNLGPIVNNSTLDGSPRISPDGSMLYFCSNRTGGSGSDDIYQAPIIPIVDFNGDGEVDGCEVCTMADCWGTDDPLCDIGPMAWGDGVVDVEDLKVLAEYIGEPLDDPTLVAHWALDEAEGTIAYDSAGEYDGTLNGEPLWRPDDGIVNGAIELDGTDDYISTPFVINPYEENFSVFTWIKGGAPGQVIISQQDGVNWLLSDPTEGNLMTELKCQGRSGTPLVSNTVITDGNWHRICFVWDSSYRVLYVDDVEVASDAQVGLESSEGVLYIGVGKNFSPDSFFSGLIDDVRIYNRAVTP